VGSSRPFNWTRSTGSPFQSIISQCDAQEWQHPREDCRPPPSTGDRLLTDGDILQKCRRLAHYVIDVDRQSAIEKVVLNLEALDDISTLIHLLTPKVRAVLG
jgi:hypothetical protein